jgi:hypothetical protein
MIKNHSAIARRLLIAASISLCAFALLSHKEVSTAQSTRPVLISEANSTRAVALESVTRLHEPFDLNARHAFGADRRTRIQLYVLNLERDADISAITVDAEDGARRVYPLKVEHIGVVPGQEWMHSLTVRLNDEMGNVGDVLVRMSYKNVASNRVRVGIGHIGGGLPSDAGSVPTPAPAATAPTPNNNPITAGTLNTDDVRTVIAQAVSAAVALSRPVTVAVTDKEGNVLGVFTMTGAPNRTQFRGNSGFDQQPNNPAGLVAEGLEGTNLIPALNPVRRAAISKAGLPLSSAHRAMLLRRAPQASSFRSTFRPAWISVPAGHSTACSFRNCPAQTSKCRGCPLASPPTPASCRSIKTACMSAASASKATEPTR